MQERFTERVKRVIQLARQEARRMHHDYIGTEHLLLGIIREGGGVAALVLTNLGIDLEDLRRAVENAVSYGQEALVVGEIPLNQEARAALNYAIEEAKSMNHSYIGTEHLLLGLLREERGIASQVLTSLGAEIEMVRNEILRVLGGEGIISTPKHKTKTSALDYF
ncbi:MAG: Clp protease N-terminal domain-containing protein, partial [candidate division WOR-3 bacterium]